MVSSDFDPDSFTPSSPSAKGNLPAEAAGLPEAAKQFIRSYLPSDDDSGCIGTFETVSEYKTFKSKEAGKEIYEPVIFIRINIRGNDRTEVHRPATEADKRRFPFSWQEFLKGEAAASRGTALTKLPGIDPPTLRSLHAKNVFTIEDLALVSDSNLQNLGLGGREFRARAQEYVDSHKGAQEASQLQSLIAQQSEQLAKAMALIDKLSEENQKLAAKPAPERKKPGRKPREKPAETAPE